MIQVLAECPFLAGLLAPLSNQKQSIEAILANLRGKARSQHTALCRSHNPNPFRQAEQYQKTVSKGSPAAAAAAAGKKGDDKVDDVELSVALGIIEALPPLWGTLPTPMPEPEPESNTE